MQEKNKAKEEMRREIIAQDLLAKNIYAFSGTFNQASMVSGGNQEAKSMVNLKSKSQVNFFNK